MLNKKIIIASVVTIVVISAIIAALVSNIFNKQRIEKLFAGNTTKVRVAQVVKLSDYPVIKVNSGSRIRLTAGSEFVSVYSKIEGSIAYVRNQKSPFVHKGEVLARFDPRELALQQQQAIARVGGAREKVKKAEREMEVQVGLFDKNGTAKAMRDNAIDVYNIEKENLKVEEATVKMIDDKIGEEVIVSPIDGILIRSNIKEQMVVGKGQNLFEIADANNISLSFLVEDRQAEYFQEGMGVHFETKEDYNGKYVFEGKVERVQREHQSQGEKWDIKVSLEMSEKEASSDKFETNENKSLFDVLKSIFSKGFVVYLLDKKSAEAVLRDAILYKNGEPFVYVVNDNGIAEEREVELGVSYGDDYIEVLKGLKEGDKVVFVGQDKVRNGMKVVWSD